MERTNLAINTRRSVRAVLEFFLSMAILQRFPPSAESLAEWLRRPLEVWMGNRGGSNPSGLTIFFVFAFAAVI